MVSGEEEPFAFKTKTKQLPILLAQILSLHSRKCTTNELVSVMVNGMLLCLDLRRV